MSHERPRPDAKYSTSLDCRAEGHLWRIENSRDIVGCARCYQHLPVDRMLDAYIEKHGGRRVGR